MYLQRSQPKLHMAGVGKSHAEDSDEEPESLQYKVIILGDGACGKTSIAMRFTGDTFAQQYKQTIGCDFFMKRLLLPGNLNVALQIWDIGGQTIGGKMIGNYIFGAQAVLLVYDITNYQSFQDLEDWYSLVARTFKGQPMPRITLVGNKTDLAHLRAVKVDKHNQFADENEMFSCFMSAKTGDNVSQCFHRIAADLAGVVLTKPEIEVASKVVRAEVVNHQQHDPDTPMPRLLKQADAGKPGSGGCVVQ
jgi:Ras-related protein Rab-28